MKKLFVLPLTLAILLVGCQPTVNEIPKDAGQRFNGIGDDVNIITDSKTGCKYMYIDSGMGNTRTIAVSPLMKTATTVDCSN